MSEMTAALIVAQVVGAVLCGGIIGLALVAFVLLPIAGWLFDLCNL